MSGTIDNNKIERVWNKGIIQVKGGGDELDNLCPMHWANNRSKSDDYPNYDSSVCAEDKTKTEEANEEEADKNTKPEGVLTYEWWQGDKLLCHIVVDQHEFYEAYSRVSKVGYVAE